MIVSNLSSEYLDSNSYTEVIGTEGLILNTGETLETGGLIGGTKRLDDKG
jgi:hypothetical protein